MPVSESPVGLLTGGSWISHNPASWSVQLVMSLLLAGHVGLLTAAYSGIRATGVHFWNGIKSHTITFLLAKLILVFSIGIIARIVGIRTSWATVVYIVPSLILAPILGTAALHPGRPILALKAAVSRSTSSIARTGSLVALQLLLLLGLWTAFAKFHGVPLPWSGNTTLPVAVLAHGSSTLSFNPLPTMSSLPGHVNLGTVLCTVFTVICSASFLGAHFLMVMDKARETAGEDPTAQRQPSNQSA
jgi:hypothetical protein